jgi:hypothetical protein
VHRLIAYCLPFSKVARVIEILAMQVAPVARRATAAP